MPSARTLLIAGYPLSPFNITKKTAWIDSVLVLYHQLHQPSENFVSQQMRLQSKRQQSGIHRVVIMLFRFFSGIWYRLNDHLEGELMSYTRHSLGKFCNTEGLRKLI